MIEKHPNLASMDSSNSFAEPNPLPFLQPIQRNQVLTHAWTRPPPPYTLTLLLYIYVYSLNRSVYRLQHTSFNSVFH